jgi:hypothetical protein
LALAAFFPRGRLVTPFQRKSRFFSSYPKRFAFIFPAAFLAARRFLGTRRKEVWKSERAARIAARE